MRILSLVDAFTEVPYRGNPAAVCITAQAVPAETMLRLAGELNQPATAFVHVEGDGYALRWFNASGELALCGHGTLASAHVLVERGLHDRAKPFRFRTGAGDLAASMVADWFALEFPPQPVGPTTSPEGLAEALGAEPVSVMRSPLDLVVELASEEEIRDLAPSFATLAKIQTRGIIVTAAAAAPGHDFVSRFFAPRVGIDEDAATGTAHCCLGPYWSARLGRDDLTGRQLSRRGATIRVRTLGDRVELYGRAVTVLDGTLTHV